MKKYLFAIIMLFIYSNSFAQHQPNSLTIQPRIALNISNITDGGGSDSRFGLGAGFELEYQLNKRFSVAGGLLYSMQGAKNRIKDMDVTLKMDYVNMPILCNIYLNKYVALKVGVQPGFNVNHKFEIEKEGITAETDKEGVKTFDFSIPMGLSFEYNNVVIDGRFNLGMTKMFESGDNENTVFQFSIGYKFDI